LHWTSPFYLAGAAGAAAGAGTAGAATGAGAAGAATGAGASGAGLITLLISSPNITRTTIPIATPIPTATILFIYFSFAEDGYIFS
jgi:hypothetical protein